MFDENQEVSAAADALMRLAAGYNRGQCILWHEIEIIAGSRNDNRGKHIISKWRKRMEKERDIVTLAADNVGIRLLTHRETAREIPRLRQRKAYRQVRRAIKQTGTVDPAQLSDNERRLLAAQQRNMALVRRDLFRSQQEAKKVTITESNPRPRPRRG